MSGEATPVPPRSAISDEEVAALLEKNGNRPAAPGEVRAYDIAGMQRITRGRLPALESVHESFARSFRIGLCNLLKREPQVTFQGVQTQRFGDFMAALRQPASLDICRIKPLPGNALFVCDPALIFLMVDAFFGGPGRSIEREPDRGLTPTEARFVQVVLKQASLDLGQAWAPVTAVEFELVKHETNPLFASIAAPGDTVLVNRFHIELPTGGGAIDLVIPAATIEPVRELLTAGVTQRAAKAEPWRQILSQHLGEAAVEVRAVLAEVDINLGDLVRLKPGDVIPIEPPRQVTLLAGDVPLFAGKFGVSRGRNSLKVQGAVRHTAG